MLKLHSLRPPLCSPPLLSEWYTPKDTKHVNQNENTECYQKYTRKKGNRRDIKECRHVMIPNQFESIWTSSNKWCETLHTTGLTSWHTSCVIRSQWNASEWGKNLRHKGCSNWVIISASCNVKQLKPLISSCHNGKLCAFSPSKSFIVQIFYCFATK